MKETVISVENMSFAYDREFILKDISFEVHRGDFVALVGANGSGKSTLLKTLLNFNTPHEGQVKIFGEDVRNIKNWGAVGYVPQGGLLQVSTFPATVLEIVLLRIGRANFFNFFSKRRVAEAMDALRHVGIEDLAHNMIQNLSGGQLQRVLIARELMMNPEIIFLDEPTNGLDSRSIDLLFDVLEHINKVHGITIVMVTHDVMRDGGLIDRTLRVFDRDVKEVSHV